MHLEWGTVVKTLNWTFIANLVNFAILLYLMKRFLYKPALAYLDRRREQDRKSTRLNPVTHESRMPAWA